MVTKNYDHLPIDQRPRHEVEGQSCRCNQAGCPVCNVPRNPLLPESDYILAKLCVAILPRSSLSSELPDREDLDELCFLRELAELCYVSERHDLGQIFFEYFCIDPRGPLLAPLIDRYPMAEDIIAETLESIYSDIVADPETHEPRGAAEFGIGDQPKPINSPHPFDPHASYSRTSLPFGLPCGRSRGRIRYRRRRMANARRCRSLGVPDYVRRRRARVYS